VCVCVCVREREGERERWLLKSSVAAVLGATGKLCELCSVS
jgi:hypothetical protein